MRAGVKVSVMQATWPGTGDIYNGTVESRLDTARRLHCRHGEQLQGDAYFQSEFKLLCEAAAAVAGYMTAMNLGPLCSRCAAQPGGGCCSLFMAGETDGLQMLMNLLAGIEVRPVRDDGQECSFLRDSGCLFLFKPMFCLNYNCDHIRRAATPAEMGELERLTGILLTRQYGLEQYLLAMIRQYGNTTG